MTFAATSGLDCDMAARAPRPIDLWIRGPLDRRDLPGLYERVCRLLACNAGADVVCHVGAVAPDAVAVEALARLQLGARRHGCRVVLAGASSDLMALVALIGLTDVLPELARPPTEPAARTAGRSSRSRGRT